MRTHIIAAILFAAASTALAQDVIAPLAEEAPVASAPLDARTAWCRAYATWLVAMSESDTPTPAEVRATHRLETELNSCTIDPQGYERETRVEAQRAAEVANG